jgi:hypothetical protein
VAKAEREIKAAAKRVIEIGKTVPQTPIPFGRTQEQRADWLATNARQKNGEGYCRNVGCWNPIHNGVGACESCGADGPRGVCIEGWNLPAPGELTRGN